MWGNLVSRISEKYLGQCSHRSYEHQLFCTNVLLPSLLEQRSHVPMRPHAILIATSVSTSDSRSLYRNSWPTLLRCFPRQSIIVKPSNITSHVGQEPQHSAGPEQKRSHIEQIVHINNETIYPSHRQIKRRRRVMVFFSSLALFHTKVVLPSSHCSAATEFSSACSVRRAMEPFLS